MQDEGIFSLVFLLLILALLGVGLALRILSSVVQSYTTREPAPHTAGLVKFVAVATFLASLAVGLVGLQLVVSLGFPKAIVQLATSAVVVAAYLFAASCLAWAWQKRLRASDESGRAERTTHYGRSFFYLSLLIGLVLCTIAPQNTPLPALFFPLLVVALVAISVVDGLLAMAGGMHQNFLSLWQISLSLHSGRSLPDEIAQLADLHRGRRADQLRRMSQQLERGMNPSEVISNSPLMSSLEGAELAVGLKAGQLPRTLDGILRRRNAFVRMFPANYNPVTLALYVWLMVLVSFSIISFISYKLLPKFKKIFEDFGTELPPFTKTTMEVTNVLGNAWYVVDPLLLLVLFALSALALSTSTGWWETRERFFSRMWPRMLLPPVLRTLAVAVEARLPLEEGLRPFLERRTTGALRARLGFVDTAIREGHNCWSSFAEQKLLKPAEVDFLQSAERAGNLRWALETLSERIERRCSYSLMTAREYIQPALIVLLGLLVGAIVVAYFLPLVTLVADFA